MEISTMQVPVQMDIVSFGQIYLASVDKIHPVSKNKRKYVTDSAIKAMNEKRPTRTNWSDEAHTTYHYDSRSNMDIFMDYLRGEDKVFEPSILISQNSSMKIPFSWDYMIYLILGFRELRKKFGTDGKITYELITLLTQYDNINTAARAVESGAKIPDKMDPKVKERGDKFLELTYKVDSIDDTMRQRLNV